MKQLCMFLSILLAIQLLLSPQIYCSQVDKPLKLDFLNLPNQNLYWQGWIKYFHYNNNTRFDKPKSFFQNNEYFHQRIPYSLYNKADNYGTLRIPSKHSFFLVLFNDSLTFHTTRHGIMRKSYDSLKIDHINLVPEDQPLQGGIKDLGNFDEGKCFEIKVTEPKVFNPNFSPINNFKGLLQTWIICSNSERAKATLLATILKLKLKSQRNHGAVLMVDDILSKKKGRRIQFNFGKKNKKRGKPVDGRWVLLQNWTQCTLSCGGGKSYQQWLCIPPKNGGKPCKGFAVKTRDCNTQKCPSHGVILKRHLMDQKRAEEAAARPPVIKIAAFSSRPQRYSKCIIKENDAFITDFDPATNEITRQPVRIVMNNKTVTLYADEEYENKIYTFNIESTSIIKDEEFCCIRFRDALRNTKLCAFTSNCGTRLNNLWVVTWLNDFRLFKTECNNRRQISSADRNAVAKKKIKGAEDIGEIFDETGPSKTAFGGDADAGPSQPGEVVGLPGAKTELQRQAALFKQKFSKDVQTQIISSREQKIMQKVQKAQKKVTRSRVHQTEKAGLQVMGKEMELEKLIETEEKKREAHKLKKLRKLIRREKKKKNCLFKTLKKRELDTQILEERKEAEKEITHVKEEMKQEVQMKRNEMKRQISIMRKKARRRRAALESQLNKIRTQMAQAIQEANRCGDIEFCRKGKKSMSKREEYCNTNFVEDYLKNQDCKEEKEFCYMCCEHEFGNNFIDKRDECYDMCDGSSKAKAQLPKRRKRVSTRKLATAVDAVSAKVFQKEGYVPKPKQGGWVWMPKVRKTG